MILGARGFVSRLDDLGVGDVEVEVVVDGARQKVSREGHFHLPSCIPGCSCSTPFVVTIEHARLFSFDRRSKRSGGGLLLLEFPLPLLLL